MFEIICFALGVTCLLAAIMAVCLRRSIRCDTKRMTGALLIGIFFASFLFVLPTQWSESSIIDTVRRTLLSMLYSIDVIGGSPDVGEIDKIQLSGVLLYAYKFICYLMFLATPFLTSAMVISFFGDMGEKIRNAFCFWRRKSYIFSELNENALSIARSIKKSNKSASIVFCGTKSADSAMVTKAKELGAFCYYKSCSDFKIGWYRKYYEYYLVSKNEDRNVRMAAEIVEKNRGVKPGKATINAFAQSGTSIDIIESLDQDALKINRTSKLTLFFNRILFFHPFSQKCYVISALDQNGLSLANSIRTFDRHADIVFCGAVKVESQLIKRAKQLGARVCERPCTEYRTGWFEKYEFCLVGGNELNKKLGEIIKQKDHKKSDIKINSLKTSYIGYIAQVMKGSIKMRFIDNVALLCNQIIYRNPLYDIPNGKKDISVMIVGCGRAGIQMLKTAVWCGQIDGYRLKIRVYDNKVGDERDDIEKRFFGQAPELRADEYDIKFIRADVMSDDFEELIAESLDATYVFVATGEDDLNLQTAAKLRGVFRRKNGNYDTEPKILTRVRDDLKNENIKNSAYLKDRNIVVFGNATELFEGRLPFETKFEKLSLGVHLAYAWKLGADRDALDCRVACESFYKEEYNRRSSMATALHIASKLVSCGAMEKDQRELTNEVADVFEKMLGTDHGLELRLAKNEHTRWNAFFRSEGYHGADIEQMKRYAKKLNSHKDIMSNTHACITDWEGLKSLDSAYYEMFNDHKYFQSYDEKIVKDIPEIIRFANESEGE